jgi:hypothetical protein
VTVAELIAKLQRAPQDLPVVICCDRDGNKHLALVGADDDLYWRAAKDIDDQLNGDGEIDEDEYRGGVKCVVLWP